MKHLLFVHSASEQKPESGSNPLIRYIQEHCDNFEWHNSSYPRDEGQIYDNWKHVFAADLNEVPQDADLYIIGHSFGGSVVMKYLTENKVDKKIKNVILIGSPFWGCDEKFDDPQNELRRDAAEHLPEMEGLYQIHSIDDDRVNFKHQSCWRSAFPQLCAIRKSSGRHEFHQGIEELKDLIQE